MTIKEIADRLVALNREGDKHLEIYEELYDVDNVVSIENWGPEPDVYAGMDAIKAKGEKWFSAVEEMHETVVSEPLCADKSFAVTFTMDTTFKDGNELGIPAGRIKETEMAIYHVNEAGKIYKEEFFA